LYTEELLEMPRPPKIKDPLVVIKAYEKLGLFNFVNHARRRLEEREVAVYEVVQVIRCGFHEVRKDEFKQEFGDWNYAICGNTLDGRKLRLAIAIKPDGFLIITAIDLQK
jgi:Domain of unknown function (DUF4258)